MVDGGVADAELKGLLAVGGIEDGVLGFGGVWDQVVVVEVSDEV